MCMRRRPGGLVALGAFLLGLVGCASTVTSHPEDMDDPVLADVDPQDAGVGPFLKRRAQDFLDGVSMRFSVGPGLLAHARVTPYVSAGVGFLGPATSWGGGFSFPDYVLGWGLREGGLWTERRGEIGVSTFYYCEAEVLPIAGTRTQIGQAGRGPYDLGAELHLGLVGVAIDLRPEEWLDFLAGFVGNDPTGDDLK